MAHHNLAFQALQRYQQVQRSSLEKQVLTFESAPSNSRQEAAASQDYLQETIEHCQVAIQFYPASPDPYIPLAKALTERGQLQTAQEQLTTAIRLAPESAEAHQNLAEILHRQGGAKGAAAEYQVVLALKPDWPEVLNNLAWLLATHSDPQVRDGTKAVRLAEHACRLTSHTNLWFLHTLAATYAENHQTNQAVVTAAQACRLAATGQTNLLQVASARPQRYQAGQPLRSRSPKPPGGPLCPGPAVLPPL